MVVVWQKQQPQPPTHQTLLTACCTHPMYHTMKTHSHFGSSVQLAVDQVLGFQDNMSDHMEWEIIEDSDDSDQKKHIKLAQSGHRHCKGCYAYWVVKLENQRRPKHLATMLVNWDKAVGAWKDIEEQTNLIGLLCKDGWSSKYRKELSYRGIPDDSIDQGNWVYSICLRYMLELYPPSDWRYSSTQELGDEKAGDILEAIWGLKWHRQHQGNLANVVDFSHVSNQQLIHYCKCMTGVVLMFVQFYPQFLKSSEWPSSKELVNALI